MAVIEPAVMLRDGLLDGVAVVIAGALGSDDRRDRFGLAVLESCQALGALVTACKVDPAGEDAAAQEQATEAAVQAALEEPGGAAALVIDGASLFGASRGREALASTLQSSWNLARALANTAFLPEHRGGRIFLLAPPPTGEMADGARAGLENLARTLSIEWARHGVTVVTVALGLHTDPSEVGTLVAYLVSPAGSYFSGCLLDLRGPS